MKILVFGKTGQVATELQRQGDVIALGRDEADFSDPATCVAQILRYKPDVIINAVAYTAVDKAESESDLAHLVNAEAVGAIAHGAVNMNIPLVHISTDYVFEGGGETPWRPSDPTGPIGVYGASKLAGEEAIRAAGGAHVILRTSWVVSAHGNNFVKTMLRLGRERDRLTIVADQIGGPTAAADIAASCLTIAEKLLKGGPSGTYHYSGSPDVSWADFAREIFVQVGLIVDVVDIPSSDYPTPAKRPLNSRMDCSTLAADYGIECPNWRESLKEILMELG
jgi:dTDP-4-dehydrorhamnose reductase